ncbi:PTS sugar transporter subunit IIA [Acidipropionibacterium timonense]|uniref:PTS sugar transporter subunit IIA n=1 Tax=Acidipropionibacterium timonense TaxID=2161818 RepID=UPI00102FAAFF|nr:PTS sugar transporter subunit IIA [Acidipropionibacterium timonense]
MAPKLLILDVDTSEREDLYRLVNERLTGDDMVTDAFLEAVSRREQTFPTGLDFGYVSVAIPHIDPEYVKHAGILLCRNSSTTVFHAMDDPERELDVALSIWPLVTNPENQVGMLGSVIELLQSQEDYESLLHGSPEQIQASLGSVMAAVGEAQ